MPGTVIVPSQSWYSMVSGIQTLASSVPPVRRTVGVMSGFSGLKPQPSVMVTVPPRHTSRAQSSIRPTEALPPVMQPSPLTVKRSAVSEPEHTMRLAVFSGSVLAVSTTAGQVTSTPSMTSAGQACWLAPDSESLCR